MGLARKYSLTNDYDFKLIFRNGKKIVNKYFILYYLEFLDLDSPLFGIIASKKIGKAVSRNRAKRLLKESIRILIPHFRNNLKVIFIARGEILNANMKDIKDEISLINDIFATSPHR